MSINKTFGRMARWTSKAAGSPLAAASAVCLVMIWALTGPFFHYSDDWQLVINTGTTIITFLMVFFIQHSQNCDSASLHIKLDELIRSNKDSDNKMIDLDSLDHDELEKLRVAFSRIAANAADPGLTQVAQAAASHLGGSDSQAPLSSASAGAETRSPMDEVTSQRDGEPARVALAERS